ncbi:6735_t:CDS:2 [Ambispora leptoticha]|uniref:6735_t:CDS:1 n=1 Tax=Ambispora leptoticha TaxID=144679 RepID=A0A9N9CIJ1_9GLOM|nr:6735_t:CDS:2 [Ambispora leptoticha]
MQKATPHEGLDSKEFWDRLEANQEHEKRMRMLKMEMEASEFGAACGIMGRIEGGLRRSYDSIESNDESPSARKLRLIQQREVLVDKVEMTSAENFIDLSSDSSDDDELDIPEIKQFIRKSTPIGDEHDSIISVLKNNCSRLLSQWPSLTQKAAVNLAKSSILNIANQNKTSCMR